MVQPLSLVLYRLAARGIAPFASRRIAARHRAQGVPEARLAERRGMASLPRPDGPLVWIHAASVGESLSILPLIDALTAARQGLHCLVTTGTATSAEILARRLPARTLHQFAPLDSGPMLRRFLRHWRPDLLVCVESELWPGMLMAADRAGLPRALINARLSARSLRNWARFPATARALLAPFRRVTAQTEAAAAGLRSLGAAAVTVTGDMKAAAPAPPADPAVLDRLTRLLEGRKVWAAVSTHPGEDEIVLAAHDVLLRTFPNALLILCPRHPDRADAIATLAPMRRRSRAEGPEGAAIWLTDTLGETGLWFRLAPVVFMGGSLVPVGGHNPWEPARCGAAILHGPHVESAASAYASLDTAGGAQEVRAEDLGAAVTELLCDASGARAMGAAARDHAAAQASSVTETAQALLALLRAPR